MLLSFFAEIIYFPRKREERRASTVSGYESAYVNHIKPVFGTSLMEEITVEQIESWLRPMSFGQAEKSLKTLRQIYRAAIRWQHYRGFDPTQVEIDKPKRTKAYRPKVLLPNEVKILLRGLQGDDGEAVILCAVTLGLRRGEACALEWADINLKNGEVKITKSRQIIHGEIVTLDTKTAESNRICYLPRFARKRLAAIKRETGATGLLSGDISPDKVAARFKSACRRYGLPYTPMTNLRHTWASMALQAGTDIAIVAMMLGHTELDTSYKYYLSTNRDMCSDVQSSVERLIL